MQPERQRNANNQLAGGDLEDSTKSETSQRISLVSNEEVTDYGAINSAQIGVKTVEAISTTWTKWGLIVAYISYVALFMIYCLAYYPSRILTVANATSLEQQTTVILTPFATSSFLAHSLVATVLVVQECVNGNFSNSKYF
jgi:hypothetical protein